MAPAQPTAADDATERRPYETHWQMNPVTRQILDGAVDAAVTARGGVPIEVVLDVGCGRQSNVVFPGATKVVGTDLDAEGLTENRTVDVAIEVDIVTAELPGETVDAIACIYVLEHVAHPDRVFAKLARALRPGGVFVLAVPNVSSPKAKVTRFTPLWFHRFTYERLLGRRDASTGSPFATVLDPSIRPDRLADLAEVCGLEVVHRVDFEDNKQVQLRRRFHLVGALWRFLRKALLAVTGGRVDAEHSDVVMVFHRPTREAVGPLARALTETDRS